MSLAQIPPEDLETCRSIVEDELTALEAIYPDCVTRKLNYDGITVKLELAIDLGSPRRVFISEDQSSSTKTPTNSIEASLPTPSGSSAVSQPLTSEVVVSYLPPLILDLFLPHTYPLITPPSFLSAYCTHSWLPPSQIARLVTHLHELWREQRDLGEGVLWRIAETIVGGDFLSDPLGLDTPPTSLSSSSPSASSSKQSSSKVPTIYLSHSAPLVTIASQHLSNYNALLSDASFASTSFHCQICFEDKKGSACVRLISCGHVFCKECLRDGWGLAVREGDVGNVRCADMKCVTGKRRTRAEGLNDDDENPIQNNAEATEEDVRRVLTEEEVTRWRWLKVQRDIARDPTIVHCPLQFCQAPVSAPKRRLSEGTSDPVDDDQGDIGALGELSIGWQKLRTCDACGFAFCMFCKKAWHGPLTPCSVRSGSTFVREYLELAEGSPRRILMERMLGGSKILQKMIKQYQEDEENRKWLESSATRCPGCQVFCEKSHGCNHMTCVRCQMHYCYRCGVRVDPKNPYKHWSTQGNPCYNKLFDVDDPSEDDPALWEEW
ncbi:RWD-domain-containing protein [Clavulina sp. PMI_390]|nr:RWD-domain-containing protein [Clavulina sp. PMI_390]